MLGVRDGLQPIAGALRKAGTPSNRWNSFLFSSLPKLGLDARWTAHARQKSFSYPQTEYHLRGEVWRLPGQSEHPFLSPSAREAFSDLVVACLRENSDAHFTFSIDHWRGFERIEMPTPLQIFLHEVRWPASLRRVDDLVGVPRRTIGEEFHRIPDVLEILDGFRRSGLPQMFSDDGEARVGIVLDVLQGL
jgi:hypothetical protein